jgi:alpha-L-rhamnosidase
MLTPTNLRCEYLTNPLGIDVVNPRLSWVLESDQRSQRQSAFRILVASTLGDLDKDHGILWDSGRVESRQSAHVTYAGSRLQSGRRCWWKVRVWDQDGESSPWSEPASWQMGLLDQSDWHAGWISFDTGPATQMDMKPCAFLRRSFQLEKPVKRATLYAAAKGLYELHLNGHRVGDAVLCPGWTDYRKRIQYQVYDVTDFTLTGDNAVGAILGDGWYHGHVGHHGGRSYYGPYPQFLAQLNIEYDDNTSAVLTTDDTWKASPGPILFSDLLMGETYDARLELPGWDQPGFDESGWRPVRVREDSRVRLVADRSQPIRVTQEIRPVGVTRRSPGTYIFDMGQNMVGWARLRVDGQAATAVRLRFAEVLNPDGSIHTDNLRSARATDTYILKGGGPETYEPRFTFHGFRYVEVTGYAGELTRDAITGCVIHSDLPAIGSFECSNPMVNQLWRNILWGQRGNFVSVPTDCPQRDERLGWMGDALVFALTACLNMDCAPFFTKWMIDVQDGQSHEGAFPNVAPRLVVDSDGAPAWGDAGIVVPWTIHRLYGDKQIIERHFGAMARWMDYIHEANPHWLRTKRLNNNFGDWVAFDDRTSKELVATTFWANNAKLMSEMAEAIGRTNDAKTFRGLFQKIKSAFNIAYVYPDGRIEGDTQTAYVLALSTGLLPEPLQKAAAEHLVRAIERRDWHLSTGFLGSAYLCPVLAEHGFSDVAYRLLNNDTCPSWGYMVKNGATTIWERWNSWTEEDEPYEPRMNSFNHYAFGAVGEWLYRYVGGIDTDPQHPGFEKILIRPRPGGGLTYAKTAYESIRGRIGCDWRIGDGEFLLDVTIPANTSAVVHIPAADVTSITEGGHSPEESEGVRYLGPQNGDLVFAVDSGNYQFVATHDTKERRHSPKPQS